VVVISDDFFLNIATRVQSYKAEKIDGILQSGFCVSGLTISGAKSMIEAAVVDDRYRTALIYLGSIDIISNKFLIDMMQNLSELICMCLNKGIRPILSTIAPMPKLKKNDERLKVLEGFNTYIRENKFGLAILDINAAMNDREAIKENYYQYPRRTSGFDKPLLLWTPRGCRHVHEFVSRNLGFAVVTDNERVLLNHM
jgi:hypothetical protein